MRQRIIILSALFICFFTIAGCGSASISRYIEQGEYEKAWEKAKTDTDRQQIIEILIMKENYDKAWELADTYELKQSIMQSIIENLLDKGNYKEAYARALSDEDRRSIYLESDAAVVSAYTMERLKDQSSFSLKEAGSDDEDSYFAICTDGDIDGRNTTLYWLYNRSSTGWVFDCVLDENGDVVNENNEIIDNIESRNLFADAFKDAINTGRRLKLIGCKYAFNRFNRAGIDRINKLAKNGNLSDITPVRDEITMPSVLRQEETLVGAQNASEEVLVWPKAYNIVDEAWARQQYHKGYYVWRNDELYSTSEIPVCANLKIGHLAH